MTLHAHVAYRTTAGGGAEEEVNTANYGRYQVPEGDGQWLLGFLPLALTPAVTCYMRLVSREWDGEDIYGACKPPGAIDPSDYEWLAKPRFCPGGSLIYIYVADVVNEVVQCVLIFKDISSPSPSLDSFRGESVRVNTVQVANTGAAAWTQTRSWQAPKTRDPFLIVGTHQMSATGIVARLVIPNQKNSCRPPVFITPVPAAGVEGQHMGRLLEPVEVKGGELIYVETFATGAAIAPAWIEYVPKTARSMSSSGRPVSSAGGVSVYGGQPILTRGSIVGMALGRGFGK